MQINMDKPINSITEKITFRHILIALILILTVISRLYILDARVMSHDEVNHVVPSFDFYSGKGYAQDPITHGPLQFHLLALSYFLFGDNDFTSRLPHALFSIATVAFVLIYYRRYLGKYGSLAAGIFFAISPFMMFYGRYARNDAICVFLSVVTLYMVLRYLEEGKPKHLMMIVLTLALNFTAKETAYIFTAQLMIFLFILSIKDFLAIEWPDKKTRRETLVFTAAAILIVAAALGASILLFNNAFLAVENGELSVPEYTSQTDTTFFGALVSSYPLLRSILPIALILFASIIGLLLLRKKYHWDILAQSRSFNMLLLIITLVLPLLSAFPVVFSGITPTAYDSALAILADYVYIMYFFALAIVIGSIWRAQDWWKYGLIFFGLYILFFTTFFTNTVGILTGIVGSLGHWVSQQDVARGGQPIYYFALIEIPIYEFLGAAGTLLAFIYGIKRKSFWSKVPSGSSQAEISTLLPIPAIFIYFAIISLISYSLAGEKMPWLTVHIVFSMLLAAGWFVEQLFNHLNKQKGNNKEEAIRFLLTLTFVLLFCMIVVQLWGNHAPLQGKSTQSLQDTNHFIFLFLAAGVCAYFLFFHKRDLFKSKRFWLNVCLALFLIMAVITTRSAYRASFINYDYPLEYLVYAHASDGPKIVLDQIEEISRRLTGGLDIKVAYDNHGLYPYWWYLRNYPNKIVYLEEPTRTLEEADLIIAGSDKYDKIDAIVRDNFYVYEYTRLWWPMQDYWNLNWERISDALSNADMRQGLFDIWLNRDYSEYSIASDNQYLTLNNWIPSEKMRFYVRKDIAAQMWQLNTEASMLQTVEADPYAEDMLSLAPVNFIGISGSNPGELNTPHGIAVGPDGSIYVADSGNNRIQKFAENGELLASWGTYANAQESEAPGGTMNEPWDIAVAQDGSIYVADTFNHRIQKLNADGKFVKMIGTFAQGEDAESFWGPRGIAVDPKGNVLVTDTGNKRVVVYDKNLNFLTQFGGAGFEAGQFDEPVGLAASNGGLVAVADTWNRRIQVFEPSEDGLHYTQVSAFDVEAWYGTGIDNKPYITFSPKGNILISDPNGFRILEFTPGGEFVRGIEDLITSSDLFSQPYGLVFDSGGNLWVSDASSDTVMKFEYQFID